MRAVAFGFFMGLMGTPPAEGHCYSVWHYPSPQRCNTERVAQRQDTPAPPVKPAEADLPAFTVNRWDTIILTPVPGRTDEEGRADAIKILKQVMGQ